MKFWPMLALSAVGVAVCCLGPYLISLAVVLPLWLVVQLGELGWWVFPAVIVVGVLAWQRYRDRRACCRVKNSNPDES